jgi:hypothetical protein
VDLGKMCPVTALQQLIVELERDASASGWDRPPRLYALVPTADLLEREPQLRLALADRTGELTAIEQEEVPIDGPFEEFLGGIMWPTEVVGAAVVMERLIVPDETGAPEDESSLAAWAADHPGKQEVRMVAGVLRDGSRFCALRLRSHDFDEAVITGPDVVPGLLDLLASTFAD